MRKVMFMALIGALLMTSCKTPNIVLSNQLKENTSVYEVKGRQGWQINQVIRYGDFMTSKVKRGWTTGYSSRFIVSFKKASEKLSYTQYTPSGESAEVFCIGKFKQKEIPMMSDFFGIPVDMSISLEYEDIFAGSISNDDLNWSFILYNPDNTRPFIQDDRYWNISGEITNTEADERIIIRPVHQIEGQYTVPGFEEANLYGFEFFEDDKPVAAVSLVNNGRVWVSNQLNKEKQLIISSVMTGLMVRHSMSESVED